MPEVEWTTVEDGIALLTIDRPERRNALDGHVLGALHRAVDEIAGTRDIKVVVLTGNGPGFCAGADMKGNRSTLADLAGTPTGELAAAATGVTTRTFLAQELMAGLFEKIHRMRQPVIAAIRGAAHGGGFALALASDVRIAGRSATFGAVFIERGVSACDMGTSYFLPRLVGASRAAELMLTGRVFDAHEADRIGLVSDVVDDDQVIERAMQTARSINRHSPFAVWMTKETMWQTVDSPSLRHALDLENRTQIMCTATGDLTAAFAAFRERRPVTWTEI